MRSLVRSHRPTPHRAGGVATTSLLLVALVLPPSLAAQTGQVTGRVTDASTGRPIAEAQIHVPGTGIGVLTRADGRYLLVEVPVGTHPLRAERIGMESQTQEITVTEGASVSLDFALQPQALGLDEIVVTGTAGAARRREVGSAIAEVDLSDSPEPVTTVDQALAAQAPGVTSLRSSGMAGSGSQIRLRGNVSVAMSNQPLIFIDGVRIRSDGLALNHAVGQHVAFGPKDVIGPLNDINPADIERIEIVKGPAATALYGTEAAGGVIQIFTKKGGAGPARWSAQMDQGVNWVQEFGPANAPFMRLDPWLRNAHQQRYSMSVRGGGSSLSYYISGGYDNGQGILPNDAEEKYMIRGNFGFRPVDNLELQWNTSITRQDVANSPSGSSPYSISHNGYKRSPADGRHATYVGSADEEVITRLLDYEITTEVNRVVTGLTATYSPMPRFTNRLTIGLDRINSDMRNIRPFGYVNDPNGSASNRNWTAEQLTVDYVGSYELDLSDDVRTSLSWGGQGIANREFDVGASGRGLPGPGDPVVSSAAIFVGTEARSRVVTAGVFGQALFDLRDRYFLTVALRVDGNSAFGSGFGLQPYPRATFSWVASDESFWPEALGQMKMRFAYGHAGRAPGAFDAVRTWQPVPWLGSTSFLPLNLGNPDLGPERTVEIEGGFDATFLDDRLSVGFTYYNQETRDALIQVEQVPSTGFIGGQLQNVGVISNSGIELAINGTVLRSAAVTWDLGLDVYTNHSEVVDLGGAAPFGASGGGWVEEGQPVPAIRFDRVTNPDALAEPIIEEDHIWGPNQPTLTVTPSMSFTFGNGIVVSGRAEYQGGHYIFDRQSSSSAVRGQVTPLCDAAFPMRETARDQLTAMERYMCTGDYNTELVYPNDFFRVRDLTAQVPIPFRVPGASSATFTASVKNFLTWKNADFLAMDPEMAGNEGMSSGITRAIWEHPPPPATFLASIRLSF